jgi:hypothetical protein
MGLENVDLQCSEKNNHSQQTVDHYKLMKVVSYEQGVLNLVFIHVLSASCSFGS